MTDHRLHAMRCPVCNDRILTLTDLPYSQGVVLHAGVVYMHIWHEHPGTV